MILRTATHYDMNQLLLAEQSVIAAERPMDSFLKEGPIRYYDLEHLLSSSDCELAVYNNGLRRREYLNCMEVYNAKASITCYFRASTPSTQFDVLTMVNLSVQQYYITTNL